MATRRVVSTLLAAVMLMGAPMLGCANSDLVEAAVPSDGVELRYDLQPGATFDGHIRRRESISMREQPMTRSINFTVQLIVNNVDEVGNAKVAATIHNIELNWAVPGLPISTAEFNQQVKARLEGVTIRFSVDAKGKVFDVPPAPAGLAAAEITVLDSVIEGLTSAFFIVPDQRLGAGEGWEKRDTRGREGKLGKFTEDIVRGSLVGMFEHRETKQKLAQLQIEGDKTETATTKDGSSETRTRSDVTVLFDTEANYMASIDSKMTRSHGPSTTTVQFDADWTRSIPGSASAPNHADGAAPDDKQVQTINDACSDDYVGPDDCLDACSVNYMGDDPCAKAKAGDAGALTDGGDAADADDEAAPAPEGGADEPPSE